MTNGSEPISIENGVGEELRPPSPSGRSPRSLFSALLSLRAPWVRRSDAKRSQPEELSEVERLVEDFVELGKKLSRGRFTSKNKIEWNSLCHETARLLSEISEEDPPAISKFTSLLRNEIDTPSRASCIESYIDIVGVEQEKPHSRIRFPQFFSQGSNRSRHAYLVGAGGIMIERTANIDRIPAFSNNGPTMSSSTVLLVNGILFPYDSFTEMLEKLSGAMTNPIAGLYLGCSDLSSRLMQISNKLERPIQILPKLFPAARKKVYSFTGASLYLGAAIVDLVRVNRQLRKDKADPIIVDKICKQIRTAISSGKPYTLLSASYGSFCVSKALRMVATEYESAEEAEKALEKLTVVTLGGAGRNFPDGPKYIHCFHKNDPVAVDVGVAPVLYGESSTEIESNIPLRWKLIHTPLTLLGTYIPDGNSTSQKISKAFLSASSWIEKRCQKTGLVTKRTGWQFIVRPFAQFFLRKWPKPHGGRDATYIVDTREVSNYHSPDIFLDFTKPGNELSHDYEIYTQGQEAPTAYGTGPLANMLRADAA